MAEDMQSSLLEEPKRKRPRAARACQLCRSKKYRCDEQHPCSRCKHLSIECVYEAADHTRPMQAAVSQKERSGNKSGHNINPAVREFHGSTSSIAFLAALDAGADSNAAPLPRSPLHSETFVSTLHNDAFSPGSSHSLTEHETLLQTERFHFKQSRLFLEGHFQNIHFVHPILDKTAFMNQCEDLWFNTARKQPRSFVALYYSIMSLGALVRTWDDDETIDGKDRLQWSRYLFDLSCLALNPARFSTDLDTIQTCFFLAKVCQNELNPSLAYMYLGLATRASFAAGINRKPRTGEATPPHHEQGRAQLTWWSLYALEIELSFSLGRPDSLGPDQYHNTQFPPEDASEVVIIASLVHLAKIIRRVCTDVYLSDDSLDLKLDKGLLLEAELDVWLANLPEMLRPDSKVIAIPSTIKREPRWTKLQRIVLCVRYYNVKLILLRPFLARGVNSNLRLPPVLSSVMERCVDAGRATILQLHNIYINQPFFRTWWNNITYTLYAASTILWYCVNVASAAEASALLDLGRKAIEILDVMDESVVARKACEAIRGFVAKAQVKFSSNNGMRSMQPASRQVDLEALSARELASDELDISALHDADLNLDFFDMTFPVNEMRSSFWADYTME